MSRILFEEFYMSKSFRLSTIIVVGAILAGIATTSNAEIKIGFVDPVALIQNAPQSEAALQELEREFRPRNDDILKLQDRIRGLDVDLEKNALVWSEAEIQNAKREIDALKRRMKRTQEEAQEDYNLRRNEELARIQGLIREVVLAIAKDEGYDLILETGVVYVSPKINLTERILEELENL
jgi:outer membrane protein